MSRLLRGRECRDSYNGKNLLANSSGELLVRTQLEAQLEVLRALDDALGLGGRAQHFSADTPLLGSLPELDSMAVVDLVAMLEDRFSLMIEDEEITGQVFATVGSLADFVHAKLTA